MKNIAILGSTGSIGENALNIIESEPDRFRVVALAARTNVEKLAAQIEKFHPKLVSVADAQKAQELRSMVKRRVRIVTGAQGAIECATHPDADIVVAAMVGAAGLPPTHAAVCAGKQVALANKETLVIAGGIVMQEARRSKAVIIPVDSEHSAVFQALRGEKKKSVRRLILTASGGPFLGMSSVQMSKVTVERALKHPNWSMGPKISIDSATMMNKGLEVIEARWLFNMPPSMIEVVVHPQSIVHSMVEFHDSSVIAQMGPPDMRSPISFALNYPDRLAMDIPRLDFSRLMTLTFEPPDLTRFPCLALAYQATQAGPSAPAVLSAANEVAVEAFLNRKIGFLDIPRMVEKTLNESPNFPVNTIADVLAVDHWARARARELIGRR
ncbi:MAG: 1-deoxy-D-xylulose-5-phosphate reductoisomerase [Nitrospinae bacterium]|nr:1-deoxy-D-xylulose-5-phosphate reductoisomerase [Nitrospinota bacterium]